MGNWYVLLSMCDSESSNYYDRQIKWYEESNEVEIQVNGEIVDIPMKVGDAGEAFFVVETEVQFID
jgi:phosphatidate phosphatase PAH1